MKNRHSVALGVAVAVSAATLALTAGPVLAQDVMPYPSTDPTTSSPSGAKADLVVPSFVSNGTGSVSNGYAKIPVKVTVKNQGATNAPAFKIAVTFKHTNGATYVAQFSPEKTGTAWYVWQNSTLTAGTSATLTGWVTISKAAVGSSVVMTAVADSCAGDEFMPSYCRVNEQIESNNGNGSTFSVPS